MLKQAHTNLRNALAHYRTLRLWVSDANRNPDALPIKRGDLLNMCRAAKAELREACTRAHIAIWQHRASKCALFKHQAW